MGQKIRVDLDDDDVAEADAAETAKVKKLAAGRPSVHRAKMDGIRSAKRVQFSFSQVPEPIKVMFMEEAARRGMGLKEFLFHCLREQGLDIPPYDDIDGRRR